MKILKISLGLHMQIILIKRSMGLGIIVEVEDLQLEKQQ